MSRETAPDAGPVTTATTETRARVRKKFIDVLNRHGLKKPKKITVADHEKNLKDISGLLAYLSGGELDVMVQAVLSSADGPGRDLWPPTSRIMAIAHAMRQPPRGHSQLIVSYMASAAGRVARDGDYHAELLLWMKRHGRAPTTAVFATLRKEADKNRRRRTILIERRDSGRVIDRDDQGFLDWYGAAREAAADLVGAQERVVD